jgi:putative transposase
LGREEWKTAKASKFSDAQKAFILKQGADGMPAAEICRKAGISQATHLHCLVYRKCSLRQNMF